MTLYKLNSDLEVSSRARHCGTKKKSTAISESTALSKHQQHAMDKGRRPVWWHPPYELRKIRLEVNMAWLFRPLRQLWCAGRADWNKMSQHVTSSCRHGPQLDFSTTCTVWVATCFGSPIRI
ncbi:hypothetical protein QAD02_010423 [Eretmocerus hayati]|uniref:Uncharacterized protein n=1 Tax=Eretmocerus hayati TaxID=131215 RepID=A0ACC2NWP9_9HYME|nr:hypothetical protein QAD02_010423 [Eretmocerus hayati]